MLTNDLSLKMRPGARQRIILLFIIAAVTLPLVQAAGIGISPTSLSFEKVLRDGYAESGLVVTTSMNRSIGISASRNGDIAEWLHFPSEQEGGLLGTVSMGNPLFLPVAVVPPGDIATGDYKGYLLVETGALGSVGESMGSSLRVSLLTWVDVEITGEEIRACQAGGITIPNTEPGMPLEVSLVVKNTGNVRASPKIELNVWDRFEEELLLSERLSYDEVLPTTKREQRFFIEHGLEPGQYWALVTVPECGASHLLTFDVLPPGGVVDRGVLEGVSSSVWAYVGDLVPVQAVFLNKGERSVRAIFKGTTSREGRVVGLLTSEEVIVGPGERAELVMFFKPEEPGQYELSGRVHYNMKLTYERGTLLNVNPKVRRAAELSSAIIVLYIGMVLGLAVLLWVIKKERNKHS